MAYIPETKDKTARVSPAAQRALGPEDPRAREEVEAQKNQKFSTWDQIGMAADMLPGGAMAVRGGRQIAEAVLSAVQSGTVQDAMKLAANAAKTDKDVLRQALQHLDRAFTEAKRVKQEGAEAVYTAAKNSIEAVLDRTFDVRGRAKSVEHKAAKETMRREGREPSTLGQSTPTAGAEKGVQASKATRDVARPSAEHKIEAFVKDIHSGRVTRQNEKIIIDKIKASPEEIPDLERAIERMLRKADDENTSLIISLQKIHKHIQTAKKEAQSGGNTFLIPQNLMPPAGRMKARDLPSPSGKGRLDQKSVHGKAPLDDLSQMVSDVKSFDDAKLNSEIKRVKDLFEQAQDPLYHTQHDERLDRYYTLLLDEIRRRGL